MSGKGAGVRRARLSDAGAIADAMSESIRGLAQGSYGTREIALWSSLPPLYHSWAMTGGEETYLVAERDGRLVGYAAVHGHELTAIFVRPAVARQGIGLALLRAAERLARRRGVRELIARAALGAVGFYEHAGFRRTGTARVPLPGSAYLQAVLVTKTLAEGRRPRRIIAGGRGSRSSPPRPRRRGARA